MRDPAAEGKHGSRRRVGAWLWVLAVVLMLAAAVYQRRTGPTYPVRTTFAIGGTEHEVRLPRSESTTRDARVSIPDPGEGVRGTLRFRRFPTDEPFDAVPLHPEEGRLVADLPAQPPAGKVEYFVELEAGGRQVRIPEGASETVILRFKGDVPAAVLAPHVLIMFLSMLVGMRAALAAALGAPGVRRDAWMTLGGITVGGMILGPIVQKYAFGAYWTGVPFGYDLTDNKTLIMWVAWIAACAVLVRFGARRAGPGRFAVVAAALVMTVVYLIPHSFRGSELDYDRLDAGANPAEAVRTAD